MGMSIGISRALATVVAVCLAVSLADAQQPPAPPPSPEPPQPPTAEQPPPDDEQQPTEPEVTEPTEATRRPFRGLFGGARPAPSRGQLLDFTLSAFGGWDEPTKFTPPPGAVNERVDVSGPFGGSSGTITYTKPGKRLNLSGFGSGFVGYFPDNNDDPWYPSTAGAFSADYTMRTSRRSRLTLSQREAYYSDYRLGLFTSDVPLSSGATGFDNSLLRAPTLTLDTGAAWAYDFSRRTTFNTFYIYRNSHSFDSGDVETLADRQEHSAGFRLERRVTRDLSLRAGYAFRHSLTDGVEPFTLHDIDVGVNYSRSFSVSRRTRFSFNTGTTLTTSEPAGTDGVDDGTFDDVRYDVVGGATLTHEIGRTWQTYANYERSVDFDQSFNQPFLGDTAVVGLGGLLGGRTDVTAQGQWQSGAIGLDERNFESWTAYAQVRTALTQKLAVFAHYYYYHQDYGAGVPLPEGVVPNLGRQGVRVGLTAWFPIWSE